MQVNTKRNQNSGNENDRFNENLDDIDKNVPGKDKSVRIVSVDPYKVVQEINFIV